jgi:hypothetical protein
MNQDFAVWLLIVLALITANLPFLVERPFLALPWRQRGEVPKPAWLMWLSSVTFFLLLAGVGLAAMQLIGHGVFAADAASALSFFGILFGLVAAAAVLLAYPGWRNRGRRIEKSVLVRLLELLVFYGLVGVLGLAFESSLGNRFPQGWEFYAITLCLYLVLGYPGFVWRYLMKRRRPVHERTAAEGQAPHAT